MHILNFKAPIKKKVSENRYILWVIDWVDICIHVPAKYKYQHNLGLTKWGLHFSYRFDLEILPPPATLCFKPYMKLI